MGDGVGVLWVLPPSPVPWGPSWSRGSGLPHAVTCSWAKLGCLYHGGPGWIPHPDAAGATDPVFMGGGNQRPQGTACTQPRPCPHPKTAQRWGQEWDPNGLLPLWGYLCRGRGSSFPLTPPRPPTGTAMLMSGCRGALGGGTVTPGCRGALWGGALTPLVGSASPHRLLTPGDDSSGA